MRAVVLAFVVGVAFISAARAADPFPADVCQSPHDLTLTGTVEGLEAWREEPQAEFETTFHLKLSHPLCCSDTVGISIIGVTVCDDGFTATVSGRFSPPDDLFPAMIVHGEIVDCAP